MPQGDAPSRRSTADGAANGICTYGMRLTGTSVAAFPVGQQQFFQSYILRCL